MTGRTGSVAAEQLMSCHIPFGWCVRAVRHHSLQQPESVCQNSTETRHLWSSQPHKAASSLMQWFCLGNIMLMSASKQEKKPTLPLSKHKGTCRWANEVEILSASKDYSKCELSHLKNNRAGPQKEQSALLLYGSGYSPKIADYSWKLLKHFSLTSSAFGVVPPMITPEYSHSFSQNL